MSDSVPKDESMIACIAELSPPAAAALAMHAKLEPLARFGAMVLDEARDALGDLGGDWLQDTAVECGLLEAVEVTEPCDPETCRCAEYGFPTQCYRRTDAAKAMNHE